MGVLIIGIAVCGAIGALIGAPKGRGGAGLVLGLLLGPIGIIVVAVMQPTAQVAAGRQLEVAAAVNRAGGGAPALRPCPWCAEEIQPAAIVCRYCGRAVDPTDVPAPMADGMDAVRRQYPAYCREAEDALAELSDAPPTDPVAWVRRVCERRMVGDGLARATSRATSDLMPPAY